MTLEELSDAVRVRLGVPANDGFYTAETLADLVNEGLQVVSAESEWPWLRTTTTFNTVSGTATATPPADWGGTLALTIDDSDSMEWRSLIEIREVPTTVVGEPLYYTIHNEVLVLRPVPDGVYTVIHDYVKDEPSLTTNTATPLMPSKFHFAIVAFAAHLALVRAGDQNRAATALGDYQGWVKRMHDAAKRTKVPLRVRVRPGSGL